MVLMRSRGVVPDIDRWDPFVDASDLQAEMNRLLDSFFGRPARASVLDRVWAPPVDMYQTAEELVMAVELPGVSEKDVSLSITGDVLTLKGERPASAGVKREDFFRAERWLGRFERALPLPIPVQVDKVKAAFRDGILTIRLPKAEAIKPKEIKIDVM
jgi:HSP20 family protein